MSQGMSKLALVRERDTVAPYWVGGSITSGGYRAFELVETLTGP